MKNIWVINKEDMKREQAMGRDGEKTFTFKISDIFLY